MRKRRCACLLYTSYREEYKKSYAISTAKLGRLENEVSYYVENCHREGSQITVTGWCMSAGDIKLALLDGSRQPISEQVEHYYLSLIHISKET